VGVKWYFAHSYEEYSNHGGGAGPWLISGGVAGVVIMPIVAPLEATMSSSERRGEENPHLGIYLLLS
jgi:hypothetical protein